MAVDLLFNGVQPWRQRIFNLKENLLDGLSETAIPSSLSPIRLRPTSKGQKPCFETSGTGSRCPSFFASGSFFEVVGDTVGGIPKCTVSRIVRRVSTALVRKQQEFIRWPSTAAERQEISKQRLF